VTRFSAALPRLIEAGRAEDDDRFEEASREFDVALSHGVSSAELFFKGARSAARAGALDRAFAHLESLRAVGIADPRAFDVGVELDALRPDARWGPFVSRIREESARAGERFAPRIVTSDIDHFWSAFDLVKAGARDPEAVVAREYVDRASPALQGFFPRRIGAISDLLLAIDYYGRYYESVRPNTLRVRDLEPELRRIFRRMKEVLPDAVFPDVTFVVGRLKTAGTATADGLLVGLEQVSRAPDSPVEGMPLRQQQIVLPFDVLPHLVAHELTHVQQHFAEEESLLAIALLEGGADFVAELTSGGTTNPALMRYGDAHEAALWAELHADRRSTDEDVIARWAWGNEATDERPGDLAYYVGYRIVRAYYERHTDKRQALRDILDVADPEAFLAASAYSPR